MPLRHQGAGEVEQAWAQVRAIAKEVGGAGADGEQVCKRGEIALRLVAAPAREDEVVTSVVRCLPAARRDVVERHHLWGELAPAIGAQRPVLLEEPRARVGVRGAAGRVRRQLERRRATAATTAATRAAASGRCRGGRYWPGRRGVALLVDARVALRLRSLRRARAA